jgi:hypothetical protein
MWIGAAVADGVVEEPDVAGGGLIAVAVGWLEESACGPEGLLHAPRTSTSARTAALIPALTPAYDFRYGLC